MLFKKGWGWQTKNRRAVAVLQQAKHNDDVDATSKLAYRYEIGSRPLLFRCVRLHLCGHDPGEEKDLILTFQIYWKASEQGKP